MPSGGGGDYGWIMRVVVTFFVVLLALCVIAGVGIGVAIMLAGGPAGAAPKLKFPCSDKASCAVLIQQQGFDCPCISSYSRIKDGEWRVNCGKSNSYRLRLEPLSLQPW